MSPAHTRWYRYWADQQVLAPTPAPSAPARATPVRSAPGSVVTPTPARSPQQEPVATSLPTPAPVIVVANQKGGVGKTTTAVNVAAALGHRSVRVLLVDLDPQGNASSGIGSRPDVSDPTVYDALLRDVDVEKVSVTTAVPGVALVPANLELAGAEIELVSAFSREQRLRQILEPVRASFDVVLVDCPPSLGLLTINALTAATDLLVPVQCEYFALEGIGALQHNVGLVRRQLNPSLRELGYVVTMYDGRTRLSDQVEQELRTHFGSMVFDVRIPRSVRMAEAPSHGRPITSYDPGSRGAVAYHRLADEVMQRLAGRTR